MYKSNYGNSILSLSEGWKLIARYNRQYGSVEIADLDEETPEWIDYDPVHGASGEELTKVCESLYNRCLLQELEVA